MLCCALLFLGGAASAEEGALRFIEDSGTLVLEGLSPAQSAALASGAGEVRLQLVEHVQGPGMPAEISDNLGSIEVQPRFALTRGREHSLSVILDGVELFSQVFTPPLSNSDVPVAQSLFPSGKYVPANTLRFYLLFSSPMARGQVRESIRVRDEQGQQIHGVFLNLETELWGPQQRRLTLIVDPGRVKRGVGPNQEIGPPFAANQAFTLEVAAEMESADGAPLGEVQSFEFSTVGALRDAIDPSQWQVNAPKRGSDEPLIVRLGRLIDSEMSTRLITVLNEEGERVPGRAIQTGTSWIFSPLGSWIHSRYSLVVSRALEDVAGNTIGGAFDSAKRAPRTTSTPIFIDFLAL